MLLSSPTPSAALASQGLRGCIACLHSPLHTPSHELAGGATNKLSCSCEIRAFYMHLHPGCEGVFWNIVRRFPRLLMKIRCGKCKFQPTFRGQKLTKGPRSFRRLIHFLSMSYLTFNHIFHLLHFLSISCYLFGGRSLVSVLQQTCQ